MEDKLKELTRLALIMSGIMAMVDIIIAVVIYNLLAGNI